jgi:hypothetical protein
MRIPIYAGKGHEIIIEDYLMLVDSFVVDVANKQRYENFKEVMDIILEYHNNYGKYHKHATNWYDWIMIIPINVSVMTNGFFAGIETKKNAAQIRAYKILLNEKVHVLWFNDKQNRYRKCRPRVDGIFFTNESYNIKGYMGERWRGWN